MIDDEEITDKIQGYTASDDITDNKPDITDRALRSFAKSLAMSHAIGKKAGMNEIAKFMYALAKRTGTGELIITDCELNDIPSDFTIESGRGVGHYYWRIG